MITIFQIFTIFGIVSGWAQKSLADGKVTLEEATALIVNLAQVLSIPTEIEFLTPQEKLGGDDPKDFNADSAFIQDEPFKQHQPN